MVRVSVCALRRPDAAGRLQTSRRPLPCFTSTSAAPEGFASRSERTTIAVLAYSALPFQRSQSVLQA